MMLSAKQGSKEAADDPMLRYATRYGMEINDFRRELRCGVFAEFESDPSETSMLAFLSIAESHSLDIFRGELKGLPCRVPDGLGGYRETGNVIPFVSADGWRVIISRSDKFDGFSESGMPLMSETTITVSGLDGEHEIPEWVAVPIYVKDQRNPVSIPVYYREFVRSVDCWLRAPFHMMTIRSMVLGAKTALGITGVYEESEAREMSVSNTTHSSVPHVSLASEDQAAIRLYVDQLVDQLETSNIGNVHSSCLDDSIQGRYSNQSLAFAEEYLSHLREQNSSADASFSEEEHADIPVAS